MQKASDIRADHWIHHWLPAWFIPYAILARWDRPIGTWLLLFPTWWGLALASEGLPSLYKAFLFALGAFVMRGAGCTINDMVDREMDRKVARTAERPLASGVLSMKQALLFVIIQIVAGLGILLAFQSWILVLLAASSLILVVTYPFMKRFTFWPQAFLGLTFNWGALLGWVAVRGELEWPAIFLYIGGIFWTLHYDTIYAHQDKIDDAEIGVKSTARLFAERTKSALAVFSLLAAFCWALSFYLSGIGWLAYLGIFLSLGEMARQIYRVELNDPASCLAIFKANRVIGWLLLFSIVSARFLA